MERRTVVVGAAFGAAALVLSASIFLGPPAGTQDIQGPDGESIGAAMPRHRPGEDAGVPGYSAEGGGYEVFELVGDNKARITLLDADSASTQGQGITHFMRPRFQIITTEFATTQVGIDDQGEPILKRGAPIGGQAMILSADAAEMEMDGNNPQRGVFQGNVVVTLLKAEGQAVILDPADPRYPLVNEVQRVYIDGDARFGLDTNEVRSNAPVHVTSAQADFFGIGLVLKYNTARERIEQLVVREGRYLMFNPDAQSPTAAGSDAPGADGPPNGQGSADSDEPDHPLGPSQFYIATFYDDIIVRDTDRALLEGDELNIRFSLGREAVEPEPVRPATEPVDADRATGFAPLAPPIPGMRLAQADTNTLPPLPPPFNPDLVPPINQGRSLYTAAPHEGVLITWTGALRLVPLNEQPEELEDDKDIAIALQGEHAYAQAMRDGKAHRIEGTSLRYLVSSQEVFAQGNENRPITIISTEAGTLTGGELVVNIPQGTATILGPGTLTQNPDDDGKQLTLAWTDRVDLELFLKEPDGEAVADDGRGISGQSQIAGIRTATFVGDVTADHPDFDLEAEQLAVDFLRPDEAAGVKNDPTRIQASVDVTVRAQGDAPDEQFAIGTQSLTITLGHDTDGEVYAKSMRALADVVITRPGSTLTCHRVDVAFALPSETEPPEAEDATRNARYAQVQQIVAVGDVRAEIEEQGNTINLAADHLLADVDADRLTLYATEEGALAEVIDVNEDRFLRGRHIVMDDQAQVVRVEGPGTLAARMEDPDQPGNPQANMTIDWQRAMRFNNATGKAEFHGGVAAVTRRTADTTDMTCDDLEVWFTQTKDVDADAGDENALHAAENDAPDAAPGEDETDLTNAIDATGRDVRRAVATGEVRFVAATRAAEQPDKPHSRVTITGPQLIFTNDALDAQGGDLPDPVETVVVNGPGTMLIEDYTPEDPADETDRAAEGSGGDPIAFTGKGQTAFLWQESMELDARANTATFAGDAIMLHDPTPDDDTNGDFVRLDCQELIADMRDTGGLGVWMSDDAPAPEISVVTAAGPLRIRRAGMEITGNHLRYEGQAQRVEIWANENRDVLIQQQDSPAPTRAAKVIWDLAQDRIETLGLRGVTPAER
ncbi:hypothetical protein OT109_04465 [Phycisphaeraceae bacterium D3-23]